MRQGLEARFLDTVRRGLRIVAWSNRVQADTYRTSYWVTACIHCGTEGRYPLPIINKRARRDACKCQGPIEVPDAHMLGMIEKDKRSGRIVAEAVERLWSDKEYRKLMKEAK